MMSDAEILFCPARRLDALAGCLYRKRGFETVLAARGHVLGPHLIAVREDDVVVVGVDSTPPRATVSSEELANLLAAGSACRRLLARPVRLAWVSRGLFPEPVRRRCASAGIDCKDGMRLVDEAEADGVAEEEVAREESRRCASFLQGVELARRLLPQGPSSRALEPSAFRRESGSDMLESGVFDGDGHEALACGGARDSAPNPQRHGCS
jgi:hypothetical protein